MEIEVVDERAVLVPKKLVDKSQAYFCLPTADYRLLTIAERLLPQETRRAGGIAVASCLLAPDYFF